MKPETLEMINTQINRHRNAIQTIRTFRDAQEDLETPALRSLDESIKKLVILPLEHSIGVLEELKKTEDTV